MHIDAKYEDNLTVHSPARRSTALGPTRDGARNVVSAFVSLPVSDPVYSPFVLPS